MAGYMAPYLYRPLNDGDKEIRTMTLLAGRFSDEIHVTIKIVPFLADGTSLVPKFEALSYTWGLPDRTAKITIHDDLLPTSTLAITRNLAIALRYLRHEHKDRMMWIDAVCISQDDLGEKSSQVQRMVDIYSHAELVVAWLGPESDDSGHALRLLDSLGSRIRVDWTTLAMHPVVEEDRGLTDRTVPLSHSTAEQSAINSLFLRSWFERIWIRQEIQLASKAVLICGYSAISWPSFRNAVFCLSRKPKTEVMPSFLKRIDFLDDLVDYGDSYSALGFIIYQTRYCKCSDPRDRVYAVLGLLHEYDKERWTLKPDYTSTTCQVYEEVSFSYMKAFGGLDLLPQCDIGNRDAELDLPSWVPDWGSMENVALPIPFAMADCNSPGDYQRRIYEGSGMLEAMGVHVDKIEEVIGFNIVGDQDSYYEDIRELQRVATYNTLTDTYIGGGMLVDALCRTFRLNIFQDRWDPPVSSEISEQEGRTSFSKLINATPKSFQEDLVDDPVGRKYIDTIFKYAKRRSFIVTKAGYIGLAPTATRPGDHVCVLLGCNSPLVIRLVGADTKRFQVVGETYVDSAMTGEAFLGPLPEDYQNLQKLDPETGYHKQAFFDRRTSVTQWDDPRWAHVLGEDFEQRLELQGMTEEEEKACLMREVVKARGMELACFEFI
ncbi:hypothetical protein MMC34_007472 [Xylographa carneopallida]|nr:hypothetical protein [Xylographa carneopallida]